jgi:hypothetical protein
VGGTCSAHGRVEKCIRILVGKPEMEETIQKTCVGRRVILECIIRM